jgi:DNA-binding MarR family transcriptional regulator
VKLHFVLADTYRTYVAAVYENEHRPYKKRIVTVGLTPEQEEAIRPREVGMRNGARVYEEILDVILEEQEARP